eukprot:gene3066-4390_t
MHASFRPAVLCTWAVGLLALLLVLIYPCHWGVIALSFTAQSAASGFAWFLTEKINWPYTVCVAYAFVWSANLFLILYNYDEMRASSGPPLTGGEVFLAPGILLGIGLLAITRKYQVANGGLIPDHLPQWCNKLGHALAVFFCVLDAFYVTVYAIRWEMKEQRNFFVMCRVK